MRRLVCFLIMVCLCSVGYASEPLDYSFAPAVHKSPKHKVSYDMSPKVFKKVETVKVKDKSYVCDSNGCYATDTTAKTQTYNTYNTTLFYRLFRRR